MNFQTQLIIAYILFFVLFLSYPEISFLIRYAVGKRKIKRYAEKYQYKFDVRKIRFGFLNYLLESNATGVMDGQKIRIAYSQNNSFRDNVSMLTVTLNGENPTRGRLSVWPNWFLFRKARPYFHDGWDQTFRVDSRPVAFGRHVLPPEIREILFDNANFFRKRITVHVQRDGVVSASFPTSRASIEIIDKTVQAIKEISRLAVSCQVTGKLTDNDELDDPDRQ
jgi:hypothetical protein